MKVTQNPTFDFRAPKSDEEFMDVSKLLKLAFAGSDEPRDTRDIGLMPEQFFCAYDGDHLASTAGAFDFDLMMNGRIAKADGVTIVCTDPAYRRQGLVRKTMTQILHAAHERGVPIAILWASMGAIYQRFGYGLATNWNAYAIAPKAITFRDKIPLDGCVRRIKNRDAALEIAGPLYDTSIKQSTLSIRRDTARWNWLLPKDEKKARNFAAWFDASGTPRGYLIYELEGKIDDDGMYQILSVVDFIWSDMNACRGLWQYLADHDLGRTVKMNFRPDDDPVTTLLLEPRGLKRRVSDGIWLRVVDVDKALEARGYDMDGSLTLTIEKDDLCPWNEGTWSLTVKNGEAKAEKTALAKGDITLAPQALATLISGYRNASQLSASEQITGAEGNKLRALDLLFSTRFRPNCTNMF
ncbi:MAG: GNAT family N-acetyltransferase [Alphaproteobacteria bacterium]|nr:MAG: GNAT family N-acetyltransferase [Alphaproteobacteria bacterium]